MRFEIKWITAFVLFGLSVAFVGVASADEKDQVDIAKAKAKAMLALKTLGVSTNLVTASAKAKATAKPLYVWVKVFRRDIADKLPPGIHVKVDEYHGYTEAHLVIKVEESKYQFEQSKLDPAYVDMLRRIVQPDGKGGAKKAPMVDVSRESDEPPLLSPTVKQPLTVAKACNCSPLCVCGCQTGEPCQCKTSSPGIPDNSTTQAGSGIPYCGMTAAVWPAPAGQITGPVLTGERAGSVPVMSFFH